MPFYSVQLKHRRQQQPSLERVIGGSIGDRSKAMDMLNIENLLPVERRWVVNGRIKPAEAIARHQLRYI